MTQNSGKHTRTSSAKSSTDDDTRRRLKFTPPALTATQIKQHGAQASQLLASTIFNLAVQSVVSSLQDRITATEPHEVQKREWLNLQTQALGEVCQELIQMVNLAKALEMSILNEEQRNQVEQSANRGFGVGEAGSGYDGAFTG